jgi:hypothetical protein
MRIAVKDAETGNKIDMNLESNNTIDEIIESAAEYWKKDPGAYVIRFGKKVLRGLMTLYESEIQNNDVLELIPDPEGGLGDSF